MMRAYNGVYLYVSVITFFAGLALYGLSLHGLCGLLILVSIILLALHFVNRINQTRRIKVQVGMIIEIQRGVMKAPLQRIITGISGNCVDVIENEKDDVSGQWRKMREVKGMSIQDINVA